MSAGVHAAVVIWIGTRAHDPHSARAPRATTLIEIVAVEPHAVSPAQPLDVAIVDDAPVEPGPPATVAARSAVPRAPAPGDHHDAIAVTTPGATTSPTSRAAGEPAPRRPADRPGLLTMRRGDAARLATPSGRWDDLDHAPRGTVPEQDQKTGILRESGGGTRRSDQGVFVAKVNPDGTVKLTDRRNLHVHLALPSAGDLGRGLAAWYETDRGTYGEPLDPAKVAPLSKDFHVTPGASTDSGDRASTVLIPVIGGGFDINDWLMRRHSGDPYASRKLALLDATRDERAQLGGKHRAEQLKRAAEIMQRNLDALWQAIADPRARKQALFELWDECVEVGDPTLVAAGQAARRLVIGFIRARLPAGSAAAYTPTELAELARTKQSAAAFTPYE